MTNNNVRQLPSVIIEQQPRINNHVLKSETCYTKLKTSIGKISNLQKKTFQTKNERELTNILKNLQSRKDVYTEKNETLSNIFNWKGIARL